MGRAIVTKKEASFQTRGGETKVPDTYVDKLIKYIPAEVIAIYIAMESMVAASGGGEGGPDLVAYWIIFGFCLVATPLYLWRMAKVEKPMQLVLSTLCFLVWAYALGGPFEATSIANDIGLYKPLYGGLILMAFTFAIPMMDPDGNNISEVNNE